MSDVDHSAVFRRYDIRGSASGAQPALTAALAQRLGGAIASLLGAQRQQRYYVGRDQRLTSPVLYEALVAGLVAGGCQVVELAAVPTPLVNFAIAGDPTAAGGAMVTASHNPPGDNGFKLYFGRQVASPEQLEALAALCQQRPAPDPEPTVGGSRSSAAVSAGYLDAAIADLTAQQPLRPRKIVIDTANAVAGPIALELFERLGMQVVAINSVVDGHFPGHHPNPSDANNLTQLQAAVVEHNAELGLAFDGDADRLVAVAGDGAIVWPDRLLMLFAEQLLGERPGAAVVYDIKCSYQLERLLRAAGAEPLLCRTGHAFIRRALADSGAALAGEFSGHFFFPDRWHPFDDGLYAGARLLQLLDQRGGSLASAVAALPHSVASDEILVPIDDRDKFRVIEQFIATAQFDGATLNPLDGLRAEFAHGWGLVRASNTGPALTLRFEATDREQLAAIQTQVADQLRPLIPTLDEYLPPCH